MTDSDDKIPETARVSITPFVGDQMFQRWLLDKIHHRKEMNFVRVGLPDVVGFLTGMDDLYFSVSTSERSPRSRVLLRTDVREVAETGLSLHEMERSTQALIKRYTARIHRACAEQLIPSRRMAPVVPVDRVRQETI